MSNERPITYNGETHSIAEWGRKLGLSARTISVRLEKGYPLGVVLSPKKRMASKGADFKSWRYAR